jgi:hypothetical protein
MMSVLDFLYFAAALADPLATVLPGFQTCPMDSDSSLRRLP